MLNLFLLFTLVPACELILLLQVHHFLASQYGFMTGLGLTVGAIFFTGVAGASLARSQGLRTISRLQQQLQQGVTPADDLIDGVMIFVGGALLLTPGFLTDVVGFSLLLPFTRPWIRGRLKKAFADRIVRGGSSFHFYSAGVRGPSAQPQAPRHRPDDVIDIEADDLS